ncbi:MAG: tRNA (guanosine(37)-N1)-methyltransferase TrmD [Hyphomicrobiaceae bacterium]|nr:tRNA (guanosine(37)-N1)-methyltransferase TrmD [Hyphomicrobiaceae bacterium]
MTGAAQIPPGDPARAPWRAHVLTLFPEMFPGPLGFSLVGSALDQGRWSLTTTQIRDFGIGRHRNVDDTPAGGGAGMVLRCDVVAAAIDHARTQTPDVPILCLSPRGEPFTQEIARQLAAGPGAMFLAGRFEGIDQRVIDARGLREISIGDFVLSGGELAAMVIIDACVRLLPGVLGAAASLDEESFSQGTLEYPQYTRPREWEGRAIPEILMSGDHGRIAAWRQAQSLSLTRARRPDLLAGRTRNGDKA